ncbi:MAG: PEP-CTERM sorting domain-containing protein [Thermoguttaceae bacterium]|jgi:hypothetical protein|nr:PEP-CTERM sorting domain-containing protein [Thermoguttaceae bacterium]
MRPLPLATLGLALSCAAAPAVAVAAPILFDFGSSSSSLTTPDTPEFGHYNNLTSATSGSIANAVDAGGVSTGIGAYVTTAFNGVGSGSTGGVVSSAAGFHENAQRDSFYRNAAGLGTVQLRNLDSAMEYDIVLFSSRLDTFASDDPRISQFLVGGRVYDLNSRGNASFVAEFAGVQPQYNASLDSYVIDVSMQRKDGSSHAYMNAMKLTPVAPSTERWINYDKPLKLVEQDFNSLAKDNGTWDSWTNGVTLPGWYAAISTSGTFAIHTAWDGAAGHQNSLLSLGTDGNVDRALGFQTLSGSVDAHYGLRLVNTTDMTLNEFSLSYKGEQWRWVDADTDSLLFDFQVFDAGEGSLTAATGWTAVDDLRFDSPTINATSNQGLDGNLPENSEFLTATTRGFSWEPGQELWLRWTDTAAGWQMMGIDDVSFRAIPEPGSLLLLLAASLAGLMWRGRRQSG